MEGIEREVAWRKKVEQHKAEVDKNYFVPQQAYFTTWLNQRRWEQTPPELPSRQTSSNNGKGRYSKVTPEENKYARYE